MYRSTTSLIISIQCLTVLLLSNCSNELVDRDVRKQYLENQQNASLVIYPIDVIEGLSQRRSFASAESLAVRLQDNVFGMVSVADLPLPISVDFAGSSVDIQRATAWAFTKRIRAYSPPADFAIYAEIFLHPCSRVPFRAHYYICNYEGILVDCGILDEEDEIWKLVQPSNEFECTGVMSGVLFK